MTKKDFWNVAYWSAGVGRYSTMRVFRTEGEAHDAAALLPGHTRHILRADSPDNYPVKTLDQVMIHKDEFTYGAAIVVAVAQDTVTVESALFTKMTEFDRATGMRKIGNGPEFVVI
jgi:hypothetical protein